MTILSDEKKHERRLRVKFTSQELEMILGQHALKEVRLSNDPRAETIKLTIKQEEEGSPSYAVQKWSAVVEIVLDYEMTPQAMATGVDDDPS